MNIQAKVSLVGAGPGDPDLITLKGVKALKTADVVLYDALANQALLKHTKNDCIYINVGKRSGKHCLTQTKINQLIVEKAKAHGHVVRLKGGDPTVFGRGTEEAEYCASYHIPVELIQGVSSCISVPASVGIPVTKRGVSDSFWVLTGHTQQGALSNDFKLAARSNATVIVLMGIKNLKLIIDIYLNEGRNEMPVAIIFNGTHTDQKLIKSSVSELKVTSFESHDAGIIVIGEVVRLATNSELISKVEAVNY